MVGRQPVGCDLARPEIQPVAQLVRIGVMTVGPLDHVDQTHHGLNLHLHLVVAQALGRLGGRAVVVGRSNIALMEVPKRGQLLSQL